MLLALCFACFGKNTMKSLDTIPIYQNKMYFCRNVIIMAKKNQSKRLTAQHIESHGVIGIFGEESKLHDMTVGKISHHIIRQLEEDFPQLVFRYRPSIEKKEINEALRKIDPELGQTLFVENASIIPDGGIIEVKDDNDNWRIVLVSEAKHQGKDIENIKKGNTMNIIVKPLISEKMTKVTDKMSNRCGFVVDKRANKIQIKNAVEKFYNVKVVDVNTINYSGKVKSRYTNAGFITGKTAAYKKAIVTLAEGNTIDFFI